MKKLTSGLKLISEYEKIKLDAFFELPDVKELLASIKSESQTENGFTRLIISTEHVDRMGEVVRQDGLNSELYMKNPVILNSHNYYGIENIVGKTTKLYKEVIDGIPCTLADGVWAPTEAGKMAKALWDAGCLSAASIGFIPEEFDANNSSVITKWQMLEFSMVPVPANGEAVRDSYKILAEKGITELAIRMKGFEIKKEPTGEAEEGDECSMDDGTIGVMSPSEGGKLVCVPKKDYEAAKAAKAKKSSEEAGGGGKDNDVSEASMWEKLKSEQDMHEKAVKGHVKELCEAMKAEQEKKPEDGDDEAATDEKRMKAMEDHEKKFKTVMKAEHERHIKCVQDCVDGYTEKMQPEEHDGETEKAIKEFLEKYPESKALCDALIKAGRTISAATHEKLTTLCESIEEGHDIHTKAIDEFKALLEAHKPNEGDDDGHEPAPKKGQPPLEAADLPDGEVVKLARELSTATRDALTRFNRAKGGKG